MGTDRPQVTLCTDSRQWELADRGLIPDLAQLQLEPATSDCADCMHCRRHGLLGDGGLLRGTRIPDCWRFPTDFQMHSHADDANVLPMLVGCMSPHNDVVTVSAEHALGCDLSVAFPHGVDGLLLVEASSVLLLVCWPVLKKGASELKGLQYCFPMAHVQANSFEIHHTL